MLEARERLTLLERARTIEDSIWSAPGRLDGSAELRVALGSLSSLIVAGHAVNHWRAGEAWPGEFGTGSLALEAARLLDASAVVLAAPSLEDTNFDAPRIRGLLRHLAAGESARAIVIDLHGMRARDDGVEVLIGVGRHDVDRVALRFAVDAARAVGLEIRFAGAGAYAGAGPERLASQLESERVTALQIQLVPSIRDLRAPDGWLRSLEFLRRLARWPIAEDWELSPAPSVRPSELEVHLPFRGSPGAPLRPILARDLAVYESPGELDTHGDERDDLLPGILIDDDVLPSRRGATPSLPPAPPPPPRVPASPRPDDPPEL